MNTSTIEATAAEAQGLAPLPPSLPSRQFNNEAIRDLEMEKSLSQQRTQLGAPDLVSVMMSGCGVIFKPSSFRHKTKNNKKGKIPGLLE